MCQALTVLGARDAAMRTWSPLHIKMCFLNIMLLKKFGSAFEQLRGKMIRNRVR